MKDRFNVLILGYGEMGHAMEVLLSARHELSIWDKFPTPEFTSVALEQAVPQADFILFCLPVNPHREIVTLIKPLLKQNSICLSIAKGLDENGHTAAQVFNDVLADRFHYGLVYGPMISEEIRAGRYAFAQVGCQHESVYASTAALFGGSKLIVEQTSDIRGISWSVILKNVYAILFGIADELQLGDNARGFLMVQSVHELDRIVMQLGGEPGVSCRLAGLGDLVTTATSAGSHHHELGRLLAKGESSGIAGEGVHTLAMVEKHHLFKEEDYPLYKLVHGIVKNPEKDIELRISNYFSCK